MLDECGSNIDAAIKRLEQLRLSSNAPQAAQDPTAAETEAGVLNWWHIVVFDRPQFRAPPPF